MTAVAEQFELDQAVVAELQASFRGPLVGRDDPGYDEHRKIWNGSIQKRPALIARCAGVADVIAAVKFGRQTGLPVAVLSVDQLNSVDLITADGEFVKASADENADLFWGVRGGGGNFGIVTEFEFNCVPLGPTILAGPVFWPMEQSGDVLRFYRDWVADAPDDLMTIVVHRKAPPLPFVPQELHGKPVVMVVCCWAGEVEKGERFIRPLKEFNSPVADVCVPKPFLTHQAMFDPAFVPGRWYYFKSCDVPELTDEVIDITVEHSLRIESPQTSFPIWQKGGAVARVGENETAFNGRNAGFTYNIGCCTETSEGFEAEREWARNFWSALEPWHEGVYINFLGDEGADRVRESYGAEKYDRLRALKHKYDLDNFFRINQNIPPT